MMNAVITSSNLASNSYLSLLTSQNTLQIKISIQYYFGISLRCLYSSVSHISSNNIWKFLLIHSYMFWFDLMFLLIWVGIHSHLTSAQGKLFISMYVGTLPTSFQLTILNWFFHLQIQKQQPLFLADIFSFLIVTSLIYMAHLTTLVKTSKTTLKVKVRRRLS